MANSPTKAKSPFPKGTDFFSKFGAGLLADHITAVWVKRGAGNVVAERYALPSRLGWGVRSNLVAGLPPAKRPRGKPHVAPPSLAERRREFLR